MRVWFRAKMEEPCKPDGFLRNAFKIADDSLHLPATLSVSYIHNRQEGLTLCILVRCPMHNKAACFCPGEMGSDSLHIENTCRGALLLEAHATGNKHVRSGATLEI